MTRDKLPYGNADGALTLAQILATAIDENELIEVDTLADLQSGPTPAAGRVAEVAQSDIYLGDGSQWIADDSVSFGSANNPSAAFVDKFSMVDGVYDIREYGADAFDNSDDSSAIQSTIDAASSDASGNGGTVYIPAGTYTVDNEITYKSNVDIVGANRYESVIKAGELGTTEAVFRDNGYREHVRFANFRIYGSEGWTNVSGYDPAQKGIYGIDGSDLIIENMIIRDTPATAIGTDGIVGQRIVNNWVIGAGTDGETTGSNGIGVGTAGKADQRPCIIANNVVEDTAEFAVIVEQTSDIDRPSHWVVENNTLWDARVGIGIDNCRLATVTGNTIEATSNGRMDYGIQAAALDGVAPRYVTVTSNSIEGPVNSNGIFVATNTERAVVVGNSLESADVRVDSQTSVVNGGAKVTVGVGGTPTYSNWEWAPYVTIQNADDQSVYMFDANGDIFQLSAIAPTDLSGVTGSFQGQEGYNDGTTGTEGPAFWNGSSWISSVDGSAI